MPDYSDRYMAYRGMAPERIPHYEHWSCPDAESYITGIDYYEAPRSCRVRMGELYPQLELPVPPTDDPIPRPDDDAGGADAHAVRWGDGMTWTWDWGEQMKTPEDVFAFSPLEQGDFTHIPVVESRDYRDEEALYQLYRRNYPAEWGDAAPRGSTASAGFYNTMFMWPLLTFGWELFLETCLDPRFERIMEEFAEINRRVFRVFARLPIHFVFCHDDIVTTQGPVCPPDWMRQFIFPRYEEYWAMLREAGKEVIFIADGCLDACAADIFACGAQGIITEPYTDFPALARQYPTAMLAGEGDIRVIMENDADGIETMVRRMVETAQDCGGYMMCIGNHIPWNAPPEGVKRYLDLCAELAWR